MYISSDGLSIYEPNKQDCWVVDIKTWFKSEESFCVGDHN